MDLTKNIQYLKGVGPNRVKLLNKLGIFTLGDLITYYPRTYEDRSKPKVLCECKEGEEVLIGGDECYEGLCYSCYKNLINNKSN